MSHCASTDPQRYSIFTKGPADVLDHATNEIASGSKLGIDATKKLPGESFNPDTSVGAGGDPLHCKMARLHGIFVDQDGAVYIGDSEAHRVRVLRRK